VNLNLVIGHRYLQRASVMGIPETIGYYLGYQGLEKVSK
jgi:hypothetical protein